MNGRDLIARVTRTLLTAGYSISGARRQPRYAEIDCERVGALGALTRVLLVIAGADGLTPEEIEEIQAEAARHHRSPVVVASDPLDGAITTSDFFGALGGEVPRWRAIAPEYGGWIRATATNETPPGLEGEAWALFEELVADGLEFIFGRRVHHLGAKRRGKPLSDLIAETPQRSLLVVDAKATSKEFNATLAELRPLGEYLTRQIARQEGQNPVHGALVVAPGFRHDESQLQDVALRFYAQFGRPVAFCTAGVLAQIVELLRGRPLSRNGMRWPEIMRGGLVKANEVSADLAALDDERRSTE